MRVRTELLRRSRRPPAQTYHRWKPVTTACACNNSSARTYLLPCSLVPRHTFASSRFNVVILLFLRLFYQASTFEAKTSISDQIVQQEIYAPALETGRNPESAQSPCNHDIRNHLFAEYAKVLTGDWFNMMMSQWESCQKFKIVSLTWVKALASPFSHEFIQVIVQDPESAERTRIVVSREDTGDWVICGWNWQSGEPPSHHYTLPLPLLSLVFPDETTRPTIFMLGQILAAVTKRSPGYNLAREMCWWYSEQVFEEFHAKYGGQIKEWQWSKYRYSFVVKTNVIQRKELTKHAEAFKKQIIDKMDF